MVLLCLSLEVLYWLRLDYAGLDVIGIVRSSLYPLLLAAWIQSCRHRLIHPQVRHCLCLCGSLLLFWFLVRTLKFSFLPSLPWSRYLWYLYYLPLLCVPVAVWLASLFLGKPEWYRLPVGLYLVFLPALLLFGLVMTNDFHQLVFRFPSPVVYSDRMYTYGPVYLVCMVWIASFALASIGIMFHKSRLASSRRAIWIPALGLLGLALYALLYAMGPVRLSLFRDMTTWNCLLIVLVLECCIRIGLIQANSNYERIFALSKTGAMIVSSDGSHSIVSDDCEQMDEGVLAQAALCDSILLEGKTRLRSAPIAQGRVFWQEDVSEIMEILEQLKEGNARLAESNDLLEAENELHHRQAQSAFAMQLYDSVTQSCLPVLEYMEARLDTCLQPEELSPENLAKRQEELVEVMRQMCIWGTYIKRRCNLLLLEEESSLMAAELEFCLKESFEALQAAGIACSWRGRLEGNMDRQLMLDVYDLLHEILATLLPSLKSLFVQVRRSSGCFRLGVMADHQETLPLAWKRLALVQEQGGKVEMVQEEGSLQMQVWFCEEAYGPL